MSKNWSEWDIVCFLSRANDDGSSACHIATIENVPEVLRLLMKHQADVASLDNNGKKPIDIAREKSHKECARYCEQLTMLFCIVSLFRLFYWRLLRNAYGPRDSNFTAKFHF